MINISIISPQIFLYLYINKISLNLIDKKKDLIEVFKQALTYSRLYSFGRLFQKSGSQIYITYSIRRGSLYPRDLSDLLYTAPTPATTLGPKHQDLPLIGKVSC